MVNFDWNSIEDHELCAAIIRRFAENINWFLWKLNWFRNNRKGFIPWLSSNDLFVIWNNASSGVPFGFVFCPWFVFDVELWCGDDWRCCCCCCCVFEWCKCSDNRLPLLPISGEQQSLVAELLRSEPDSDGMMSIDMFIFMCRNSCACAFKCSKCRW